MKYDLMIFDADGTLFDFKHSEWNAFKSTLQQFKISQKLPELHRAYEKINQQIWLDFQEGKISAKKLRTERFRLFFQQENLDLEESDVSIIYLQKLGEEKKLLSDAEEIVKYFHRKVKMILATNGLSDVQNNRIRKSRIFRYFDALFISEEIGKPKPHNYFFQTMLKKFPQAKKPIMIGDNLVSDIKGGNDFGIDTCWYNPTAKENSTNIFPTFEIRKLKELKKII